MTRITFTRMEIAGSLGDLGTLLPIAFGLSIINGLSLEAILLSAGLYYLLAGLWFRVPVAVQPMKVIGAYALATAAPAMQIYSAQLITGLLLLALALSGLMDRVARLIPRPVIRGVQAATGTVLAVGGLSCILGRSTLQTLSESSEPFLPALTALPWLPIAVGILFALATLFLLDNKRFPAALVVVGGGLAVGILAVLASPDTSLLSGLAPTVYLPEILPLGWPGALDLGIAMAVMVLPQLPMTVGNAVIATSDLTHTYFPEQARRTTPRSLCISMGLANLAGFFLGAMPMCHGAGGLAAHYRFGARTAGSNLIIGCLLAGLAIVLGDGAGVLAKLIPMAVLGVLLFFAGLTLFLTIVDTTDHSSLAVIAVMITLTLASNLGIAFVVGMALHFLLARGKVTL